MATSNSPNTNTSRPAQKRMVVRDYLLIWVDAGINDKDEDCQHTLRKLRELVGDVKICTEPAQCIESINEMDDGKAFVITSGTLGQHLVPQIHSMQRVDAIYIFCSNKSRYEEWARDWSKIEGVYTSIKPICQSLTTVIKQCEHDSVAMSFVPKRTSMTSGEEVAQDDRLEPSYLYTMLFKEIILEIDQDEDQAVQDLVIYFGGKGVSKGELESLQKTYHKHSAIWWYTCETFLYGRLNKSLRHLDMADMVKMGFIIKKLHLELKDLCYKQSNKFEKKFIVYRGQGMIPEDFQHLQNIKGGLLAFNCFLSTSNERGVALDFITRNLQKYKENVGVLFHMTIDQTKVNPEQTPFAPIRDFSASEQENEILFSMHTVFRVNDIKQSTGNKRQWDVQLVLTDDNDPELGGLVEYMKKDLQGEGWFRMGKLMLRLGDFEQAEGLYNELLGVPANEGTRALVYHQLGEVRRQQGRYKEATEFYEKYLQIYRKTVKEDDLNISATYNNIALAYDNMGEYSKALEYYKKSLKIKEKALLPTHSDLATSYSCIGGVYSSMGEYSKALQYYEKSLKIREEALPLTHPDLAISYNNIGMVYNNMGEYSKALEYYEKSRKIREKALPPTHPDLATSYGNIGEVYSSMGKYSKALQEYEKSRKIREKALPLTHPDLATSYSCIGGMYSSMGEYSKALQYYEKSLKIREKALSSTHPDLAISYGNIGGVYNSMGEYSKALEFCEKSQKLLEKALPPTHPDLATSYNNMAIVYYHNGNYTKARDMFEKSCEMFEECLPADHLNISLPKSWLGRVYQSLKQYPKALDYFEKAIRIREKSLGEEHPYLAITFCDTGDVHRLMGAYEKALEFHRKALNIQENVECNPLECATTYVNIGETYRELKDYSTALTYYQKGFEIRENKLPKDHPDLAVVLHGLAKLYSSKGDYRLAMKNVQQAIEIGQMKLPSTHPHLVDYKQTLEDIRKKL